MENKKKKTLITLLVLAVFVVLAVLLVRGCEQEKPCCAEEEQVVEELTEEEIAIEIEACEKETAYFQSSCFSDLAELAKDPDLCDRVEDITDEGYGDSSYFIHKGVCLAQVAKAMDYDYSLCDRVSDNQEYYDLCIGNIAVGEAGELDDPEVCEILGDGHEWYEDCLAETINSEDEIGICDLVSDEWDRDTCVNLGYVNLSVQNEDISYCDEIDSSVMQLICVGSYADHFDDLSICHDLQEDNDVCVCYNMYFDEVTDEVCAELTDDEQKSTCDMCKGLSLFDLL